MCPWPNTPDPNGRLTASACSHILVQIVTNAWLRCSNAEAHVKVATSQGRESACLNDFHQTAVLLSSLLLEKFHWGNNLLTCDKPTSCMWSSSRLYSWSLENCVLRFAHPAQFKAVIYSINRWRQWEVCWFLPV